MRESFVFYKSFYDAIEKIPQIKYRYLLLETIIKVGLFSGESIEKLESFCIESEQKLSKNYAVLGIFLSIKPQLIANYKKYLNGCKGADSGRLGGAPLGNQNARQNNPKTTPNVNENDKCRMKNENENEKENVNVNVNIPTKKEIAEYTEYLAKHIDVDMFFEYYGSSNWLDSGGLPINWKQKVIQWANRTTHKPRDVNTGGLF